MTPAEQRISAITLVWAATLDVLKAQSFPSRLARFQRAWQECESIWQDLNITPPTLTEKDTISRTATLTLDLLMRECNHD